MLEGRRKEGVVSSKKGETVERRAWNTVSFSRIWTVPAEKFSLTGEIVHRLAAKTAREHRVRLGMCWRRDLRVAHDVNAMRSGRVECR